MTCTCSETWIKKLIKERGHAFTAEHSPGCDKRAQAARDVALGAPAPLARVLNVADRVRPGGAVADLGVGVGRGVLVAVGVDVEVGVGVNGGVAVVVAVAVAVAVGVDVTVAVTVGVGVNVGVGVGSDMAVSVKSFPSPPS